MDSLGRGQLETRKHVDASFLRFGPDSIHATHMIVVRHGQYRDAKLLRRVD